MLEGLKAASVGLIMSAGAAPSSLLTFRGTDWHAIAEVVPEHSPVRRGPVRPAEMENEPILLMTLTGVAGYFIYGLS
ncbi:MAG: hypothetical protein ACLT8E_07000 [Akkermansia sp.]